MACSTAPSSPISGLSNGPTCCVTKRRRWERRASGSSSAGCATRLPPTCRSMRWCGGSSPARGSTWTNPPSSFHRTNRDPMAAAETVAQVFLGIRLQCARCHNHPFDDWTQDDYYGLAACFSTTSQRKEINNDRRDNLDKHEINGDEVIYVAGPAGMAPASHPSLARVPSPCTRPRSRPTTQFNSRSINSPTG